jgi:hypothetical protein
MGYPARGGSFIEKTDQEKRVAGHWKDRGSVEGALASLDAEAREPAGLAHRCPRGDVGR